MPVQEDKVCNACHEKNQIVSKISVSLDVVFFDKLGISNSEEYVKEIIKELALKPHWAQFNGERLEGCYTGIEATEKRLKERLQEILNADRQENEGQMHNGMTNRTETVNYNEISMSGSFPDGTGQDHKMRLPKQDDDEVEQEAEEENEARSDDMKDLESEHHSKRHHITKDKGIVYTREKTRDAAIQPQETSESLEEHEHNGRTDHATDLNLSTSGQLNIHNYRHSDRKEEQKDDHTRVNQLQDQNDGHSYAQSGDPDTSGSWITNTSSVEEKQSRIEDLTLVKCEDSQKTEDRKTSNKEYKDETYSMDERIHNNISEQNRPNSESDKSHVGATYKGNSDQMSDKRDAENENASVIHEKPTENETRNHLGKQLKIEEVKQNLDKENTAISTELNEQQERHRSSGGGSSECGRKTPDVSSSHEMKSTDEPKRKRHLLQQITVNREVYKHILVHFPHRFEEIQELCRTIQEKNDALDVYISFSAENEDVEMKIKVLFQMLFDEVKLDKYKVPSEIILCDLLAVIDASVKRSNDTLLIPEHDKNSIKLIGPPQKVDELKKHINATVQEQLKSLSVPRQSKSGSSYAPSSTIWHDQNASAQSDRSYAPVAAAGDFRIQSSPKTFPHHIKVDKDTFMCILVNFQQEINKLAKLCASWKPEENGIAIELQQKNDKHKVDSMFRNLVDQVTIQSCPVKSEINFDDFYSFVAAANTSENVLIIPMADKKSLKLLGARSKVISTKRWIEGQMQSMKVYNGPRKTPTTLNDKTQRADKEYQQHGRHPASHPKENTTCPSAGRRAFNITLHSSESLVFESKRVKNRLTIRVHRGNIVKEQADILVSCTDERLLNLGAVAQEILREAGPQVRKECDEMKTKYEQLEPGQVIPTSSGKLGPAVRNILHAVRPEPPRYSATDSKTFSALYTTFLSCLIYSHENLHHSSISIPPISQKHYGTQLVAAAFIQAVQEFDRIALSVTAVIKPRNIHMIDVNADVIRQLITAIKSLIE